MLQDTTVGENKSGFKDYLKYEISILLLNIALSFSCVCEVEIKVIFWLVKAILGIISSEQL